MPSTYYMDYANGSNANAGDSFAAGHPKKTMDGVCAIPIVAGDTVHIAKSADPTDTAIDATWTYNSGTVTLASALTANICICDANWTASANVTCTAEAADKKEGAASQKSAVAVGFVTGKASYWDLGAPTNFAAYEQVSFWYKCSVTAYVAGDVQLKLCSDAVGAVPVNTFTLPAMPSTTSWMRVTLDNAGALGNAIRSVALYIVNDRGAVNLHVDNILACKAAASADSLSLTSRISKNSAANGGDEGWYSLQSINGTTCILSAGASTTTGKYGGATELVSLYKRETIKTAMGAATATPIQTISVSGAAGTLINWQGGYNTATDLQDGMTLFDGQSMVGYGIYATNIDYNLLERISMVSYGYGFCIDVAENWDVNVHTVGDNTTTGFGFTNSGTGNTVTVTNAICNNTGVSTAAGWTVITCTNANGNRSVGVSIAAPYNTTTVTNAVCNISGGINVSSSSYLCDTTVTNTSNNAGSGYSDGGYWNYGNVGTSSSNSTYGVTITSYSVVDLGTAASNGTYAIGLLGYENLVRGAHTSLSGTGSVYFSPVANNYLVNCLLDEAVEFTPSSATLYSLGSIYSHKHDQSTTNHLITNQWGTISSSIVNRHTASGICWRFSPLVAATIPVLDMQVARIACTANNLVTVKAWMCKDNAEITGTLICKKNQIAGVATDVSANIAGVGVYEEVTITFTPTENGVVEICAQAYGGTTRNVDVDDMTITQA